MTQTPQPFNLEYLAIWPQGLQDWIHEVSPRLEDITSITFDAEVIDLGLDEHGWVRKAAGPHRYITLIAQGKTYKQTFKQQEHKGWERVENT